MNFKTTYLLFGVLAVLFAVLGLVLYLDPTPADTSAYILPSAHDKNSELKEEDVDRVEVRRTKPKDETLVFVREGKGWRVAEPRPMRADAFAVDGLVRQVLGAQREKDADTPAALSQWELDPPNETVTLKKGDRAVTLNVGA